MSNAGFPTNTRWVMVVGYDADGARLGSAVGDVIRCGTAAQANADALGALVKAFGDRLDRHEVTWGV